MFKIKDLFREFLILISLLFINGFFFGFTLSRLMRGGGLLAGQGNEFGDIIGLILGIIFGVCLALFFVFKFRAGFSFLRSLLFSFLGYPIMIFLIYLSLNILHLSEAVFPFSFLLISILISLFTTMKRSKRG